MEIYALRKSEICYELKLRGWSISQLDNKSTDELRKSLRGHINAEQGNRSISELQNNIPFEEDVEELLLNVRDIYKIVSESPRPFALNLRNRIVSRMTHVSARFKNLNLDINEAQQVNRVAEIREIILDIECELSDVELPVRQAPVTEAFSSSFTASSPVFARNPMPSYPVYKWQLHFNGSDALMPFLEQLDELCITRGVTKDALFISAYDLFDGPARVWYTANRHLVNNWEELVDLLKKRFLPANFDREIKRQIESAWQQEGENVSLFVARVNKLYSRLSVPVSESEKILHLRERLLPFFIEHTALAKINTLPDLEDLCSDLERTRLCVQRRAQAFPVRAPTNSKSTFRSFAFPQSSSLPSKSVAAKSYHSSNNYATDGSSQPQPPTSSSTSASFSSKVVCFNCKQPGHLRSSCPKPIRRCCFRCGRPGVTVRTCNNCSVLPSNDGDGK